MEKIKLAIIYYSSTGGNYQMAQWAKDEAEKFGAEVKLLTQLSQFDYLILPSFTTTA